MTAINDNPVTGFLHWRCLRCGRWTLDRWTAHACENGSKRSPGTET